MMSPTEKNQKQKMSKAEAARAAVLAQLEAEAQKESQSAGTENGKTFAELFEASVKERDFNVGDVVSGRVLEVNPDYVLVDINYKSEGLIPFSEFQTGEGT